MHYNKHLNYSPCKYRGKCPDVITTSNITSLTPSQGPSSGGNIIIINGYNLIFTKTVIMGGNSIPFVLLSNTQLQIIAPSGTSSTDITVQFRNGSFGTLQYTYFDNVNITSLNPNSGPITGGNIITITGSNLSGTYSVYFNNIVTYNFVVISDSIINVAVPNLSNESNVQISVRTCNSSSNTLPYTLIPKPMI